ncbi:hypothetical protein MP477_09325 [Chryseobacterium sp. WG23]|uniref:hypothetical protein n=1 Tax=Chryseobacterium sp. WG23 TaxID=2926910 RepID=UPI00211E93DB|nr:hypothetical protein [Chryseobacterium sp. WG23]MCQ9635151.1 hypothetical protein [Chryseobacterium sp. WG23]
MKNLLLIGSLSIVLLSCGAITRGTTGATESKLIKIVSVEQGCPVENIKIIDKVKGMGSGSYALEVCGKRMVYKQAGTTFMESSKMQNIMQSVGN